ncbi:hypothetical protein KBA73_01665 [Patescibacteria group bacterium]|nr:hypothetical protein [Patescibacteria group bacterium]
MSAPSPLFTLILSILFLFSAHTSWLSIGGIIARADLERWGQLTLERRRDLPFPSVRVGLKLGIFNTILSVISLTFFGAATLFTLRVQTFALGKGCYLTAAIISLFLWGEIENRCREWFDQRFPQESSNA